MNTKNGKLLKASIDFSVNVIRLHDGMSGLSFLKNQMARAATSIGANIHEANYAESSNDFVHKLKVALKECHETEYWLQILIETRPEIKDEAEKLRKEAGGIRYMLISSIKTKMLSMG